MMWPANFCSCLGLGVWLGAGSALRALSNLRRSWPLWAKGSSAALIFGGGGGWSGGQWRMLSMTLLIGLFKGMAPLFLWKAALGKGLSFLIPGVIFFFFSLVTMRTKNTVVFRFLPWLPGSVVLNYSPITVTASPVVPVNLSSHFLNMTSDFSLLSSCAIGTGVLLYPTYIFTSLN